MSTNSIVLELQREALDTHTNVAELVRRAYVVATKLGLEDFSSWARTELDGFIGKHVEVPPYRMLHTRVRAWNPYHGWIPVLSENADEARALAAAPCGMPIAQIQELAQSKSKGELQMPYSPEITARLMRAGGLPLEPTRLIDHSQLFSILDGVRNLVLNWTLQLEEQGILGAGMTFSKEDRTKAQAAPTLHIENLFHGTVVGSVIGASSTLKARDIVVSSVTLPELDIRESLSEALKRIDTEGLSDEDKEDLHESLHKLKLELEKSERQPGRIARFFRRVKELSPSIGALLASTKTLVEILKSSGVM